MNEQWLALAAQIAALNAQVHTLTAERDMLADQLRQRTAAYDVLLAGAEVLKQEIGLANAVHALHDAQQSAGVLVTNVQFVDHVPLVTIKDVS